MADNQMSAIRQDGSDVPWSDWLNDDALIDSQPLVFEDEGTQTAEVG